MQHFTQPQPRCGEPTAKYRIIGWAGALVASLILWAVIILAGNVLMGVWFG